MFRTRTLIALFGCFALTGVGAALAFQNLDTTGLQAALSPTKSPGVAVEEQQAVSETKLNPNGSELVVRAFTIGSEGKDINEFSFTGTLQPRYNASVGFRIAGKIIERKVELGQRIRKDDVLFRLDPEDMELQLLVARADHESGKSLRTQAIAEERRQARLRSTGSSSQSDYDLAVATLAVATARLESAERRLELAENQRSYCDLVADSDGLVLAIEAEAGQFVVTGQTILKVMQNNEMEVVVNLPEGFESDLQKKKAKVKFWSRENLELAAELREISPVADPSSRTYDAKFRLLDAADHLTIGMTATVVLSEPSSEGIEIPLASVSKLGDSAIVWRILDDGRVESVPVELVRYKSQWAIVRGDLVAGNQVVSAGVQRIDEHVTVRVWQGN
jgi:membrane fusion protein, multidrug efflux system